MSVRMIVRVDDWTDTEGFELSSALLTLDEALEATAGDPMARPFLERLRLA